MTVDAATQYNDRSVGLGIVIRDGCGGVRAVKSINLQVHSSIIAEAMAVWQGSLSRMTRILCGAQPVGPAFTSSAYFSRLTGFALPWAHQGSGSSPQPVCAYTALPFFPFQAMLEVRGVTNFPPLKSCMSSCKHTFGNVSSQDNAHPISTPCLLAEAQALGERAYPLPACVGPSAWRMSACN
ncbi:hypothetical protein LWI29_026700 [Acer saccharum]|uniref:Uncharacterized protein n=1 Tax=Acer saccharum TaxID=4024 RepID=A0AA39T3I9_ACESA|nr:hypothetical protein LWI29_026700 [Acer saccharum]